MLFQVDADGLLSVSAQELSTGQTASIEVKPSYGLSDSEIAEMLKASFDHAQEDAVIRSLTEARIEAGRVIEALSHALDEDGEALLGEADIHLLRDAIEKLQQVVSTDNTRAITDGTEMLGKASEEFASLRMNAAVRKALAGKQIDEVDQEV